MSSIKVEFTFWGYWGEPSSAHKPRLDYSLDVNTTYEEIIQLLIQKQFLLPLNDSSLRYYIILTGYDEHYHIMYNDRMFGKVHAQMMLALSEGQALASTPFIKNGALGLYCEIYIWSKTFFPLMEEPDSTPPSLGERINAILTSPEAGITNLTGSIVTITVGLIALAKWWSKKHNTDSASLQKQPSQPSETDIVAIRLRMSHGDDPEFEEWLTDPDRLKHYINVFNQHPRSIQPLYAIFVQRNGNMLRVDVSEGAQNNIQLNELLSYLHINSAEK